MKKLFLKLKKIAVDFLKWVWSECKDWRTLILLGVVCLVIGLPVWGGYLLALIFHWNWAFWVASVCWAFWMLPGAPFFALCVSITLAIKKIYEKKMGKLKKLVERTPDETKETEKTDDSNTNESNKG